jgi:protease-4
MTSRVPVLALALAAAFPARAQSIQTDRPTVPASGIAAEGGPGAIWVNPANISYDADSRTGFFASRDLAADSPTSVAVTTGFSGLQFGIQNLATPVPGTDRPTTNWSLDFAPSIGLPDRISVGVRLAWHIIQDDRNFVAYDAGGAWRPLPWIGFGAVARNINTPDPSARAQSGIGVALRPFGNFATVGADYLHSFKTPSDDPHDTIAATLRLRPARGLYLRGSVDSDLTAAGGLEVYFGKWGGGAVGGAADGALGMTAFVGTDEPGEALIRDGNKVPVIVLGDTPPYEPGLAGLLGGGGETTWLQTLELMRRADEDSSVRGLAIVLAGAHMSFAQAQELRNRMLALEADGKPVLAYLNGGGSNGDWYIASAASKILLHPSQDAYLVGVSSETMHLRGAFDLLGVKPQFVRRAEYKSAVEQYTTTEPSGPSLEQTNALLDDFEEELVAALAAGRQKDPAEIQAWIDGGPYSADEAVAMGLADATAYPDAVEDWFEHDQGHNLNLVALTDMPQPHSGWEASSEVAIVYIEGAITSGRSSPGGIGRARSAGADTIVRALDSARKDDQVKAIVLRVDSPGGSSYASDDIHRAVERVQEDGKPVVVSMGGLAASGGYYVACGADAIWAEPTTITGSIGVFSGKFALGGVFDKVGITTTTVSRGRNANLDSSTEPWDDAQVAKMDALVGHTYDDFKAKVAEGRGLTVDQVEEVARGHVWSGKRASTIGLVDNLGGLHDAIKDARLRAGIPEGRQVALVSYDTRGNLLEALSPTRMSATERIGRAVFPDLADRLEGVSLQNPLGLPPQLTEGWNAALLMANDPDEVWMLDPSLLGMEVK